jgi:hypothetical protein
VLASNDDTDGIVNFTFTVGSTTVAPLVFTSNDGASNIGALLDNVDIASSGTGTTLTPEPATLGMLAVGLLGLAAGPPAGYWKINARDFLWKSSLSGESDCAFALSFLRILDSAGEGGVTPPHAKEILLRRSSGP